MNGAFIVLSWLVSALPFQENSNYHWNVSSLEGRSLVEYRLSSVDDRATKIFYRYDIRSGDLIEKSEVDSEKGLVASPPGTHLWWPHPEVKRSLEEVFMDALSDVGIKLKFGPRLARDGSGNFQPTSIEEIFGKEERLAKNAGLNLARLIALTESNVIETRHVVLKPLNYPGLRYFAKNLEAHDIIEPVQTKISHSETRFDAFVLFPLRVLQKEEGPLKNALHEYAAGRPRFPIEWFVESRDRYSFNVRISVLMALTHNHLLEDLLVQGVALESGVMAAWQIAKDLNQIYRVERDFWINGDPGLRRQVPGSFSITGNVFDLRKTWEVNVDIRSLVYAPILGLSARRRSSLEQWLPYPKIYHYYGAFVFAARLKKEDLVSDALIVDAAESVGLVYKLKTLGFNRAELEKMKRLYRAGATDFLKLGKAVD